ncbi:MAG: hypothetical protein KBD46_01795 [Candidatus Levybacteria bacterium]|nr:hypothetical protein [Candidatus Levybacteria bacterium]
MTPISISSEVYELSLVFSQSLTHKNPTLVFSISAGIVDELDRCLRDLSGRWHRHAEQYCPSGATFWTLSPDLFGHTEFGYGRCGFVSKKDDKVFLHIELEGGDQLYCCTMTLNLLAQALQSFVSNVPGQCEHSPQVTLNMACEHRDQHGHSISGFVSADVVAWLSVSGSSTSTRRNEKVSAVVEEAMKRVWTAVCLDDQAEYAQECRMALDESGRFLLSCFGNACDVGIYPDLNSHVGVSGVVPFGCHNLDLASQQITLISGLVKLCEIARQEVSQNK